MRSLPIIAFVLILAGLANAEAPIITGPILLDGPGTVSTRFANEFSSVARGTEVIGLWMKRPRGEEGDEEIGAITLRLGYSNDCGVTWVFSNIDGDPANQSEFDPMTAYDLRTGKFFVGGKGVPNRIFVARESAIPGVFENSVNAFISDVSGGTDKPWMAAGPKPGVPESTRIYVGGRLERDDTSFDLVWSDDMASTWSAPIDRYIGGPPLPRITSDGKLYITQLETADVNLSRALTLAGDGSPVVTNHLVGSIEIPDGFPSIFRVIRYGALAIHPTDSKKAYVIWHEKTSEANGNINVDLYLSKTTDATADPIVWSTPTIIPTGVEVPGDQFFPWLETSEDGRLHLLFMDSRHNPNQPDQGTDPTGLFDFYYAYSDNEGATWIESRLTPQSFDVAPGLALEGNNFYGDYLGMGVAGKRAYCFFAIPAGTPLRAEAHVSVIVHGTPAALADFAISFGILNGGNLQSLATSDNNKLRVGAGAQPWPTAPFRCDVRVGFDNCCGCGSGTRPAP